MGWYYSTTVCSQFIIFLAFYMYEIQSTFPKFYCLVWWCFEGGIWCFAMPLKRCGLYTKWKSRASLVAQRVKCLPTMWETRVRSLGREDPLEKAMATHSSTLAWKIPWTEKPGRLQSMGLKRVGHDWVTSLSLFLAFYMYEIQSTFPKFYCLIWWCFEGGIWCFVMSLRWCGLYMKWKSYHSWS